MEEIDSFDTSRSIDRITHELKACNDRGRRRSYVPENAYDPHREEENSISTYFRHIRQENTENKLADYEI